AARRCSRGRHRGLSPGELALHGRRDRPRAHLRGPGGHRHRERAPVHGAGGAQQRAAGGPRAADGHQRAAQGHRAVYVRPPACVRHAAENAVRLCEAERALIFRFDGQLLRMVAAHNITPEMRVFVEANPLPPGRQTVTARAAFERRTVHIHDVTTDPEYTYGVAQIDPIRTVLGIPMLRAGELLGVIIIFRFEVRPFSDGQVALMETFADQAAIAIENARLLTELQTKNASLTEALEQQTATSEILKAISISPTNVQPVFDMIAKNTVTLCGAELSIVSTLAGDHLDLAAVHGLTTEGIEATREAFPMPLDAESTSARAVRSRAVTHFEDVMADTGYQYKHTARVGLWRATLGV